jgi:hypothetical protein
MLQLLLHQEVEAAVAGRVEAGDVSPQHCKDSAAQLICRQHNGSKRLQTLRRKSYWLMKEQRAISMQNGA